MTTTIENKEQIIEQLRHNHELLFSWIAQQDNDRFELSPEAGKWSTGQHIDHLIRSAKPLTKALKMPKMMIRQLFGKLNREERPYEVLVEKYEGMLRDGGQAMGRYLPEEIKNDQKADLLARLRSELDHLCAAIQKWEDAKLSTYLLPHPILGKLTVREMLFFTVHHTEHHYLILRDRY